MPTGSSVYWAIAWGSESRILGPILAARYLAIAVIYAANATHPDQC